MSLDLEAIKRRHDYADEVACSGAEEGVWTAALARSAADVPAMVAEIEVLRSIVRRFATNRWVYDYYICFQCQSLTNADGTMDEPHSDDCPYAAAVRWVEANPA